MFLNVFFFFSFISCNNNKLSSNKNKGYLGSNIEKMLAGNIDNIEEDKELQEKIDKDLLEWAKKDLITFKDQQGKNKLMIISELMKASKERKDKMVSKIINELIKNLNRETVDKFDSTSKEGVKTIFYLINSGMIDQCEEFIEKIKLLNDNYDFGINNRINKMESALSRLIEQVKTSKIGDILDKIIVKKREHDVNIFKIGNLKIGSIDEMNNTITNIAVIHDNLELIKWIIEKQKVPFQILITDNKEYVDSLLSSILMDNERILKYILDKLNDAHKNFFATNDYKDYGRFLLIHASLNKNIEAVEKLIDMKANISSGQTIRKIKKAGKVIVDILTKVTDAGITIGTGIATWVPLIRSNLFESTVESIRQKYFLLSKGRLSEEQEKEGIIEFNKIKNTIFELDISFVNKIELIRDIILTNPADQYTNPIKYAFEQQILNKIDELLQEKSKTKRKNRDKTTAEKEENIRNLKNKVDALEKEWESGKKKTRRVLPQTPIVREVNI